MAEAPKLFPADPVAGLIDIPLPPAVSLWPQTWTSRIAIALLVASLIAGAWWLIRRWRINRYRRAALTELEGIEATFGSTEPAQIAEALASLLRRTALRAYPRESVAALAGPLWLAFLDRTGGGNRFSQGVGQALECAAYQPASADRTQQRATADLVRHWIKVHHA